MNGTHPDWFYLKLYAEPPLQNQLLIEYVYPVLHSYSQQEALKEWFFVRYSDRSEAREGSNADAASLEEKAYRATDDGHHLRIRLRSGSLQLKTVQRALMAALECALRAGYCQRWCEAFYIPEVYRYGGLAGIELAHEIFHLNSQDSIVLLLNSYSGIVHAERVMQLGDELLQCLGLDADARAHLYFRRFQWFASTYRFDASDYDHLEQLYLTKRGRLDETFDDNGLAKPYSYTLAQSGERLIRIGAAFALLEREGKLTFPRIDIFAALHHMHCNRAGFSSFKELSTLYCMYRWLKGQGYS
jgi:thiopeptide-type bacteriocin biosynthesis protein